MRTLNKRRSIGLPFLSMSLAILSLVWNREAQAGCLYAGTSNPGIVYAYDGTSWTAISGTLDWAVLDLIEFQGDLYAATMSAGYSGRGQVYRYEGGATWTLVWTTPSNYEYQVCDLAEYSGELYAGTAWNGPKLYRYNAVTGTFEYVGSVPGYWSGIRSMYAWEQSGYLQLGDIGMDYFGHFDGANLYHDAYLGGWCIYDFAEFNAELYAAAWAGRLWRSSDGTNWSSVAYYPGSNIWELEPFQGYLYMGNYGGNLSRLDATHSYELVWSSGSYDQQICSMLADGDSVLYFGTGGEAGYVQFTSGVARVYEYNGSGTPIEIFNADGGDTCGTDHAGVQCLCVKAVITVALDVKPGSCPNPLNLKSNGVLPVAVLGTEDFDVTQIDPATVVLSREGVDEGGVSPLRWAYEDVATPFEGELCDCHTLGADGYLDLTLKFSTAELVEKLKLDEAAGETLPLTLTGNLLEEFDGTPIRGQDCVWVLNEKGPQK